MAQVGAWTIEQYTKVLEGIARERQANLLAADAKIDKILDAMAALAGTNADQEAAAYILVRDLKGKASGYEKKRGEQLTLKMEKFGNKLLARLNAQGVKSMACAAGTFYKEKVYKPSCADWAKFHKWVRETNSFEMLEKRLTKKEVVAYQDANKELPPGVSLLTSLEARVRRGSDTGADDQE